MSQVAGKPALFLDRDGIVNYDSGFVSEIEKFEFNNGIFELCQYFASLNYRIIIITNQSGIGRGIFSIDKFHKLNNWMLKEFENYGCKIDLVLVSAVDPNNPSASELELNFRKPGPGMPLAAQEILNIDLPNSLLIGDRETDIEAGKNAGISNLYFVNPTKSLNRDAISFTSLTDCLIRLREIFTTSI